MTFLPGSNSGSVHPHTFHISDKRKRKNRMESHQYVYKFIGYINGHFGNSVFVFTDSFLGILASGYREGTSGDKVLLIKLTRILLLNAPFMMLAGQMNGILNSYKRFAIAAFGPVIYNICTIISIAVFGAKSAELTAWGVVAGGAVFFIIQFSGAFRHFVYYRPKLFLRSNAFSKLMHQAIPSLISSTVIEVNVIISRSYATFYESGMVTLLNNANRTWQLPLGIFAQSIGIALLPTLSEQYASENPDEFKRVLYNGLKTVFLLSLVTSVIMMILSDDIMRVLFKWGESGSEYDVFMVASAFWDIRQPLCFLRPLP